ncbi:hypothetical protein CPC08DRAFT_557399 [Agrocybe pediades]|nr:hypothetical protein CPC08DRAFT_557399 [Agrocybe pediades]
MLLVLSLLESHSCPSDFGHREGSELKDLSFLHGMIDNAGDEEEGYSILARSLRPGDDEARFNWWKQRGHVDTYIRTFLEKIKYCWLCVFKVVLEHISNLPIQFEQLIYRCLHIKEHKKTNSGPSIRKARLGHIATRQHNSASTIPLRFLHSLAIKYQDNGLEDFVFFVLNLCQGYGPVTTYGSLHKFKYRMEHPLQQPFR